MKTLECKIGHLKLSEGDIVTVQGLSLGDFHEISASIQRAREDRGDPAVLFVHLPESGVLDTVTWEWLQEWQEERLKE